MQHTRFLLVSLFLVLFLVACGGTAATATGGGGTTPAATSAPVATPTPTHVPKWTTIQSFSGNGSKKTAIFTTPDDWKILWSCKGGDFGIDGALSITVYGPQNSYIDGLLETCKAGSTTTKGEREEHQGGSVYLDIGGSSPWTIQVQAMR